MIRPPTAASASSTSEVQRIDEICTVGLLKSTPARRGAPDAATAAYVVPKRRYPSASGTPGAWRAPISPSDFWAAYRRFQRPFWRVSAGIFALAGDSELA